MPWHSRVHRFTRLRSAGCGINGLRQVFAGDQRHCAFSQSPSDTIGIAPDEIHRDGMMCDGRRERTEVLRLAITSGNEMAEHAQPLQCSHGCTDIRAFAVIEETHAAHLSYQLTAVRLAGISTQSVQQASQRYTHRTTQGKGGQNIRLIMPSTQVQSLNRHQPHHTRMLRIV
jgi:hypothetical protein